MAVVKSREIKLGVDGEALVQYIPIIAPSILGLVSVVLSTVEDKPEPKRR